MPGCRTLDNKAQNAYQEQDVVLVPSRPILRFCVRALINILSQGLYQWGILVVTRLRHERKPMGIQLQVRLRGHFLVIAVSAGGLSMQRGPELLV